MLAFTAVLPFFGKLSDMYGRRTVMLGAIIVFAIGSIGAALAKSLMFLVAARAVQGLGGAGLSLMARAVLLDIASPKDRGRYQPYFTVTFVTAGLLGPPLGGVISEYLHWSLIFWLNIPFLIVAFAMTMRLHQ
jgi:MFS family permease